MGTSDYRVVLLIDRRGANVFNQDIELYKAFFKVSRMVHVLCVRVPVRADPNGVPSISLGAAVYTCTHGQQTFADLYPMKLYRVILFPATTMTRVLWSMLRPFVHGHVQVRRPSASVCMCVPNRLTGFCGVFSEGLIGSILNFPNPQHPP